jgi:2-keto-4-pentenoate hydratase
MLKRLSMAASRRTGSAINSFPYLKREKMENNIIAADLLRLWAWNNEAGEPIRDMVDSENLTTAYMIQDYNDKIWQAQGRRLVGRKLGLTNKAVQKQFGISDPCYGNITPTWCWSTALKSLNRW